MVLMEDGGGEDETPWDEKITFTGSSYGSALQEESVCTNIRNSLTWEIQDSQQDPHHDAAALWTVCASTYTTNRKLYLYRSSQANLWKFNTSFFFVSGKHYWFIYAKSTEPLFWMLTKQTNIVIKYNQVLWKVWWIIALTRSLNIALWGYMSPKQIHTEFWQNSDWCKNSNPENCLSFWIFIISHTNKTQSEEKAASEEVYHFMELRREVQQSRTCFIYDRSLSLHLMYNRVWYIAKFQARRYYEIFLLSVSWEKWQINWKWHLGT